MKKVIAILLTFISISAFSQSINNSAQIGQTGRNQNVSRGFWVKSDTFLCNAAIWIPANCGAGKVLTSDANGLASWQAASGGSWNLTGNAGTNPATNYIGTTDRTPLSFRIDSNLSNDPFLNVDTNAINFNSREFYARTSNGIDFSDYADNNNSFSEITSNQNGISFFKSNTNQDTSSYFQMFNDSIEVRFSDNGFRFIIRGKFDLQDGTQGAGKVLTSDANGLASWQGLSGSNGSDIPAYANNAAAFAVLGAGKLYYTDVAGEYIIKVTH